MKACRDCKHWDTHWDDNNSCHRLVKDDSMLKVDLGGESVWELVITTEPDFYCAHWEEKDG